MKRGNFIAFLVFQIVARPSFSDGPPRIDESAFDEKTRSSLRERYHGPFESGKWKAGESWMGPGGYNMKNGSVIDPVTKECSSGHGGSCYGNAEMISELLTLNWDKSQKPGSSANTKTDPPRIKLSTARNSVSASTMDGYSDFKSFLQKPENRQAAVDWARGSLHSTQDHDGARVAQAKSPQENKLYVEELQRRIDMGLLPNLTFDIQGTELKHSVLLKEIKDEGDRYSLVTLDSNFPDKAHTIHVDKMTGDVSSLGAYDDYVLKDGNSAKKQLSKAVIGIGNPDGWKKVLEKHGPQAQATPRYQEPSSINGPIDFGPSAHGN